MLGLCLIYWSCQAQKLWAEAVDKALNLLIFSAAGGAGAALCAGREDLPQGWVGSWAQLLQEPLQPVWEKAPGVGYPLGLNAASPEVQERHFLGWFMQLSSPFNLT